MRNKSSVWFTLNSIINYLSGVAYCFTLILIPLGIYCFICASRNNAFAKLSDAQLPAIKPQVQNWAIFSSIVNFPIGLISIIPLFIIGDNGIKVTTVEENKKEETKETTEQSVVDKKETVDEPAKMDSNEIDEKIKKLTEFKEDGIISQEEYDKAVKELNDKK